jgi:hypothetical protein
VIPSIRRPDIEPVGEHDKAGGNGLVVRQDDSLPIRARLDRYRVCDDTADECRDFIAQRIHWRAVEDAVLEGRFPVGIWPNRATQASLLKVALRAPNR